MRSLVVCTPCGVQIKAPLDAPGAATTDGSVCVCVCVCVRVYVRVCVRVLVREGGEMLDHGATPRFIYHSSVGALTEVR